VTVPLGGNYRFANVDAARVRWLAAAAGVDLVAGDEYKEMVDALRAIRTKARPPAQHVIANLY
jgi:hypothetical protein